MICPALSEENINSNTEITPIPIWIEVGEKDTVIPIDLAEKLEQNLIDKGHQARLEIIANGDHNAPVEEIDWEKVLNYVE